MGKPIDLVQGTLDFLILKAIELEPKHGWGIAKRIQQISGDVLKVPQGSLYPALYRLERQGWIAARVGQTDNGRQVKFYALTRSGRAHLRKEIATVGSPVRSHQSGDSGYVGLGEGLRQCCAGFTSSAWYRSLLARRLFDDQLDADLRFHIEQVTEEVTSAKIMSPDDARRAALKAFGKSVGRDGRRAGGSMWISWDSPSANIFGTDFGASGGVRCLPSPSCCPSLSGLKRRPPDLQHLQYAGIAATSSFSLSATLYQVLHRETQARQRVPLTRSTTISRPDAKTIAGAFQVDPTSMMRVVVDGNAEAIVGQRVTADYFDVLGIRPLIGR